MFDLKNLFGKKKIKRITQEDKINAFWNWFAKNESKFQLPKTYPDGKADKILDDILAELNKHFSPLYALIGKPDDNTTELIITADGVVKMFVIVEDLIDKAPPLSAWKFTALKEPNGFGQSIEMYEHEFSSKTICFYPTNNNEYPDDIAIVLTHPDYNEEKRSQFFSGSLIYLENAFGELNTATKLDDYEVAPKLDDNSEEIPIEKLEDYIIWREKEFVEKYENQIISFPTDHFSLVKAEDSEGYPMIGSINSAYRDWEFKATFPWLLKVEIKYEGNDKEFPEKETNDKMYDFEDTLTNLLVGVKNIARKTFRNKRTIYFYANEFRECSRITHQYFADNNLGLNAEFSVLKDKYWMYLNNLWGE